MLVLTFIRKRNNYEKVNVYFQDFGHKFTIFKEQAFSEYQLFQNNFCRLLVNIQGFYHLTIIENQKIKVISDKNLY